MYLTGLAARGGQRAVKESYHARQEVGMAPRTHGNGRRGHNTALEDDVFIEKLFLFIQMDAYPICRP
mgnify:CR=1 FL=1|jgi:hypothetical protein